jgi:ankyrin repeat protein
LCVLASALIDGAIAPKVLEKIERALQQFFPECRPAENNVEQFIFLIAIHIQDEHSIQLMLLSKNIQLDAFDSNGQSPLHLACTQNSATISLLLIESGAEINLANLEGNTALMLATGLNHVAVVALLLCNKAKVECSNYKGCRSLHIAAKTGNSDCFRLLIEAGANPSVPVSIAEPLNALDILVVNGHELILADFFGGYQPSPQSSLSLPRFIDYRYIDRFHDSIGLIKPEPKGQKKLSSFKNELFVAYPQKNSHLIETESDGMTLLQRAANTGRLGICHLLLSLDARADVRSSKLPYLNALETAVMCGHIDVVKAIVNHKQKEGDKVLFQFLSDQGPIHGSVLVLAVEFSKMEIFRFLQNYVSLNPCEVNKLLAVRESQLLRKFLEIGYSVDQPDLEGVTLLHRFAEAGNVGHTKLILDEPYFANSLAVDYYGLSVMHHSAKQPDPKMCRYLLENGVYAMLGYLDRDSNLPHHTAVAHRNHLVLTEMLALPIVSSADAQIYTSTTNRAGMTPLYLACLLNDIQSVKIILPFSPQIQTGSIHIAAMNGYIAIVEALHSINPNLWEVKYSEEKDALELSKHILTRLVHGRTDQNMELESDSVCPIHSTIFSLQSLGFEGLSSLCASMEAISKILSGPNHDSQFYMQARLKIAELALTQSIRI